MLMIFHEYLISWTAFWGNWRVTNCSRAAGLYSGLVIGMLGRFGCQFDNCRWIWISHFPVPDEPPQDIAVHLVNLTAISITWQPPSGDRINGVLLDYRIVIAPAMANGSLLAKHTVVVRKDSRSEVIANLTAGMRYRVAMAARTEAGIGVMSKPVSIRMGESLFHLGIHCSSLHWISNALLISSLRPVVDWPFACL